ncbi:beta-ketoacyl-[acyl-carrier-protein] synthase family protein [Actinosynnema pretiosum]|uniref:3-oxoacyl-[acyl-carrier-protein] synthase 2 n=1 Tax=Actinosynnema pretiosum TaxID=42197 RepID=A0A290Z1W0_9PSEU|nr:beta-ketoacyl-[acyl-carrier-protein] synthase family protein [Actinosynnema pretiosum]ATE52982.1 beta-ketoacyl-[acyl-carrier-protein] synthase II [Actinosynnema pretiosum]
MTADIDVVVTGLGATTPLGGDVASTWEGMLTGRSGVSAMVGGFVEQYDLPVRITARLAVEPTEVLPRVEARRLDRCEQAALVAARQAWADAGHDDDSVDKERLGVIIGTGIGGARTLLEQDDLIEEHGLRKVSPLSVPMLMPNGPAAYVGLDLKARAGVHAPVSACASGAESLAWAWRMIKTGEADVVVAGGTEACITAVTMAGFIQARTMSSRNDDPARASRPFDANRDGFVLGEGAGVVVLERADFARARGAKIYGRLAGVGLSSDGHHITAADPEGLGQSRAISAALRTSGVAASDIAHVNCHATSTPVGDVIEPQAVRRSVGDHVLLTAPKGHHGHLLGASGAVEAITTVLSLRDGVIPPTLNLVDQDPKVDLEVVTGEPRKIDQIAAVNNSFGFGGHNASLVFTTV